MIKNERKITSILPAIEQKKRTPVAVGAPGDLFATVNSRGHNIFKPDGSVQFLGALETKTLVD